MTSKQGSRKSPNNVLSSDLLIVLEKGLSSYRTMSSSYVVSKASSAELKSEEREGGGAVRGK